MARGNRRRRGVAVIATGVALAWAAPAHAQGLDALAFEETVEYTRTQAGNTVGVLYVNALAGTGNRQAVSGYIAGAPFTGFAFDHDYTKQGDEGHYSLSGWADPAGAAPALPVSASLTLTVDRIANTGTWSLDGTVGGQPVHYTSSPLVLPPGLYALGGVIPLF